MLEWCYQGDNPEYVERRYEGEKEENSGCENISKALACNLGNEKTVVGVVDNDSKNHNHKNEDAKDALYFIDL